MVKSSLKHLHLFSLQRKWYFLGRYVLERLGNTFLQLGKERARNGTRSRRLWEEVPYILQGLGWASGPQTRAGHYKNTCQSRVEVSAAVAKILFHCLPKNMQGKTTQNHLFWEEQK